MPRYMKLVRDRIPELIAASGKSFDLRRLSDEEWKGALQSKLQEEVAEYLRASPGAAAVEELADVLEVLYALSTLEGVPPQQLEQMRLQKRAQRGGFEGRMFLEHVEDA
ncbi:MAG: nucleoside triphosphate pyrophosphohydrolase [Firmicutes bacterium]|nr:nucleoside triphosphate pyrophosphohydrolase [Bacillota bacterium]